MESTRTIYSLSTITGRIKTIIDSATQKKLFWIKAEISSFNIANSGHAYLDLVEQQQGKKLAVMHASIWQSRLSIIRNSLGTDFNNILKIGSEIVFAAQVNYDVIHGLSLTINDIDISFNIGALEKRKQETIAKLKSENLYGLNQATIEPLIIQNIALIASPNTPAHADFMKHLFVEDQKYKFNVTLFQVQVQGEGAALSLRQAFQRIDPRKFDAIAFIRGGGSKLDLDPYNDYELCATVARCPITVLTGIGHETDISVLDMIVKSYHKTPTALADYLIDKVVSYEQRMYEMFISISRSANSKIKEYQLKIQQYIQITQKYPISSCQRNRGNLHTISGQFSRKVTEYISNYKTQLQNFQHNLKSTCDTKLNTIEPGKLDTLSKNIQSLALNKLALHSQLIANLTDSIALLNPDKTLKRGFSISRQNGKALKSIKEIDQSKELNTTLIDGTIISKILNIKSNG
jgi:exodeoxyribonuclease VII large subunit